MRRIKSQDTQPELLVRQLLRSLGHTGYRLHRSDLPGRPDVAFIGLKKAIFIHGCFWHHHACEKGARYPKSNVDYWVAKITRNTTRDAAKLAQLEEAGWETLVVWECELRSNLIEQVRPRLAAFMQRRQS